MSTMFSKKSAMFDREEAFRYYWIDLGSARSIHKVASWLGAEKGKFHPGTGRQFTDMGVWFAVWRWALYNPEISLGIVNEGLRDEGRYFTKEDWLSELDKQAKTVFTRKSREKWQKVNMSVPTISA